MVAMRRSVDHLRLDPVDFLTARHVEADWTWSPRRDFNPYGVFLGRLGRPEPIRVPPGSSRLQCLYDPIRFAHSKPRSAGCTAPMPWRAIREVGEVSTLRAQTPWM